EPAARTTELRTVPDPLPPRPAVAVPPPVVLLSPNQQRALRYSEYALQEKRQRGDPNPEVLMSSPGGTYVIRPGGRLIGGPPPARPPEGVHADRAAGGDRDHRDPHRALAPRRPEGPRGGGPRQVHEQPQADRSRPAQLREHQRQAPRVGVQLPVEPAAGQPVR